MFKIIEKEALAPQVIKLQVEAPYIAKKAQPGQFIMLRIDEFGERIPFTIADYDVDVGTVTIIFQVVGNTTQKLSTLNKGDYILDFAGPLGTPTVLDGYKKAAVIGGGLGTAIAFPQAKKLYSQQSDVDVIAGFKNKQLVILENELKKISNRLFITTDDGSYGEKGFVTNVLKALIEQGNKYDVVVAIGPLVMMKAVAEITRPYKIKTIVSMNPIMIDGTGMCGGCRVTVGGKTKFACVDGPDFDGHLVDFDEAIRRSGMYKNHEQQAVKNHKCKLDR